MKFKVGDKVKIVNLILLLDDNGIRYISFTCPSFDKLNIVYGVRDEDGRNRIPMYEHHLKLLPEPIDIFKDLLKNGL